MKIFGPFTSEEFHMKEILEKKLIQGYTQNTRQNYRPRILSNSNRSHFHVIHSNRQSIQRYFCVGQEFIV